MELIAGEVIALGARFVRISGMPDGTICRDHRKRIAVRNFRTNRLSYIPEHRLLNAKRAAREGQRDSVPQSYRQSMIDCSVCGWRHTVPCGRDDCPHDAATHYAVIARALDNAVANGCMEELSKMSAEDIAYDLARHDSYCERLPIEILKAGVTAWLHPQPDDRTERIAAIRRALAHPQYYDGDIGADIRWLLDQVAR